MTDPIPPTQQVEGEAGANRPQQQQSIFQTLLRPILFFIVMQSFLKSTPQKNQLTQKGAAVQHIKPLLRKGDFVDMWLYVDEQPIFDERFDENSLYHHEANIMLGEESDPPFETLLEIKATENLQNNGSLYAHVFFAQSGMSPNKADPEYQKGATWATTHNLVEYKPAKKVKTERNLFSSEEESNEKQALEGANSTDEKKILSFFKPNITINLIDDYTTYPENGVPPQIKDFLKLEPSSGKYFPIIFMNDFWLLRDDWVPINSTVSVLNLTLHFAPLSLMKWQMMQQMEMSFKTQTDFGTMADGDADELKRVLLEGNPLLLGITGAVSLLHTVFDMLAFKNDVSFWRQSKSMQGLSLRTIVINICCQFVILLYLIDNETSWMILFSTGLGLCIEMWKITKAVDFSIERSRGAMPQVTFTYKESYIQSNTRTYDQEAMRYLSFALYPLIFGYAIYSMMYNTHRSWYSFILNTLVGCVYTFGFVLMCPQLYINYRLKSVAHLPWRQMTYKFLNTIIDDLFAFVIKMPTLHRLSVFRDDLIFMIYLYQRWIYRVDLKRVNEFGFGGDEVEEVPAVDGIPAAAPIEGGGGAIGSPADEDQDTPVEASEEAKKEQ